MESILQSYNSIDLDQLADKALLGRIDTKYLIKELDIDALLNAAIDDYDVLEIIGQRNTAYETVYYDNASLDLYHHARIKRPNRYKLRYRQYKINGEEYFELKKKIRGNSTLKERVSLHPELAYGPQIASFLHEHNLDDKLLEKTLQVLYDRICLVSKADNERITLDTNIRVSNYKNEYLFQGLAIVEIKSKKRTAKNLVTTLLKQKGYHPTSSSKYCLGLAFVDPDINKSGFAAQIKVIKNILQEN